jgi:hypothetical protein
MWVSPALPVMTGAMDNEMSLINSMLVVAFLNQVRSRSSPPALTTLVLKQTPS